MKCPKCNERDHEPGAKYCHMCGEELVIPTGSTSTKTLPCASVNKCINGRIDLIGGSLGTMNNNKLHAKHGDRISILVFPNHSYKLKEIKVITPYGIWRLGKQRYFEMPDCDVIVGAEFERVNPVNNKNTVTPSSTKSTSSTGSSSGGCIWGIVLIIIAIIIFFMFFV